MNTVSSVYFRYGREVKTRSFHARLSQMAWSGSPQRPYMRRIWALTPDHFAHTPSRAELNWLTYLQRESGIGGER